jgi:hypothetical protein
MRYDLALIEEFCRELGLLAKRLPRSSEACEGVEITLRSDIVLTFLDADKEVDCLMGFADTGWHVHEDLVFDDKDGNCVTMNYLDVLSGLADGQVLICETWRRGVVHARWLIHRDCNDEIRHLNENDEMRVFRAKKLAPPHLKLIKPA